MKDAAKGYGKTKPKQTQFKPNTDCFDRNGYAWRQNRDIILRIIVIVRESFPSCSRRNDGVKLNLVTTVNHFAIALR